MEDTNNHFVDIINSDINQMEEILEAHAENLQPINRELIKLFYVLAKENSNKFDDSYYLYTNYTKTSGFKSLKTRGFEINSSNYSHNFDTYNTLFDKNINELIFNENKINEINNITKITKITKITEIIDQFYNDKKVSVNSESDLKVNNLEKLLKFIKISKEDLNKYINCIEFSKDESYLIGKIENEYDKRQLTPEQIDKLLKKKSENLEVDPTYKILEIYFRYTLRKHDEPLYDGTKLAENIKYVNLECYYNNVDQPATSKPRRVVKKPNPAAHFNVNVKLYFKEEIDENIIKAIGLSATEKDKIKEFNYKKHNYLVDFYEHNLAELKTKYTVSDNLDISLSTITANDYKTVKDIQIYTTNTDLDTMEKILPFYYTNICKILFNQTNSLKIINIEKIIQSILLPIDKQINKYFIYLIINEIKLKSEEFKQIMDYWFIHGIYNTYRNKKFNEETFYEFYRFLEYKPCLEKYKPKFYTKKLNEMILYRQGNARYKSFYHYCRGKTSTVGAVFYADTCKYAVKYLLSSKITWVELSGPICYNLTSDPIIELNKYRESTNFKLNYYRTTYNNKFKGGEWKKDPLYVIYSLNYFIHNRYLYLLLSIVDTQNTEKPEEPEEFIYRLRNITTYTLSRARVFHWYVQKISGEITGNMLKGDTDKTMNANLWNKLENYTENQLFDTKPEEIDKKTVTGIKIEEVETNIKHKGTVVYHISRVILRKLANSTGTNIGGKLNLDTIVNTVWGGINKGQCYSLVHLEMIMDEMKKEGVLNKIEKHKENDNIIEKLKEIIINDHTKIYTILQCNGEPYSSDVIKIKINNTEYEFILYICCNVNEYKAWLLTNHAFTNNSLTEILDRLNGLINNYFKIESKSDNSSEYPIRLDDDITTSDKAIKIIEETYCKTTSEPEAEAAEAAAPAPAPVTSAALAPEPEPEAAEPEPEPAEPVPASPPEPAAEPAAEEKIINREGEKDDKIGGCYNIPEDTEYRPRPAPGNEKQGELWCNSGVSYLCGKNSNIYKTQLAKGLGAVCRKKEHDCNYINLTSSYSKDAENYGVYDPKFFTDDPSKGIGEENITYCSKKT